MNTRRKILKTMKDTVASETIKVKEDKDSHKYKVCLILINKILVNCGKEEVDDLTKFKDIVRQDIIKDINRIELEKLESELFKHFSKTKFNWSRKDTTKTYVLSFIRYMCDDLGYKLNYYELKTQQNNSVTQKMYYSIN